MSVYWMLLCVACWDIVCNTFKGPLPSASFPRNDEFGLVNMVTWKLGNLETWKLEDLETWKLRNLETGKIGNFETLKI